MLKFYQFLYVLSTLTMSVYLSDEVSKCEINDFPKCELRETVVYVRDIMTPVNDMFKGYTILVKRCMGNCDETSNSCMPSFNNSTISNVTFTVKNDPTIYTATITEHTKCDCACKIKPPDCNKPNQKYNKERCQCDCEKQCSDEKGEKIDYNVCECVCKMRPGVCPDGKELSDNKCLCVHKQV